MLGIFINYRRQDTLTGARAIYERLRAEFGAGQVFIDLEGLDYGEDFVRSLERQLQRCDVLLALIGPQWLDQRDARGERRLDDPDDFVRIELRTALAREVRVVPVLLDGAPMPRAAELPTDLQPLLRRHALNLRFTHFDADIGDLVASLRKLQAQREAMAPGAAQASPAPPPAAAPPARRRRTAATVREAAPKPAQPAPPTVVAAPAARGAGGVWLSRVAGALGLALVLSWPWLREQLPLWFAGPAVAAVPVTATPAPAAASGVLLGTPGVAIGRALPLPASSPATPPAR